MRKTHKGSIKTNKVVHARETEETLLLSYKTFFVGKDNRDNKELPYSCDGTKRRKQRRLEEENDRDGNNKIVRNEFLLSFHAYAIVYDT